MFVRILLYHEYMDFLDDKCVTRNNHINDLKSQTAFGKQCVCPDIPKEMYRTYAKHSDETKRAICWH